MPGLYKWQQTPFFCVCVVSPLRSVSIFQIFVIGSKKLRIVPHGIAKADIVRPRWIARRKPGLSRPRHEKDEYIGRTHDDRRCIIGACKFKWGFAIKALATGDPAMTARLPEGKCEGLSDDGKFILLRQVHRSCNPLPPRGQGRAATDGVVRLGGRVQ